MSRLTQWLSFPHQLSTEPAEPVEDPVVVEKIVVEITVTLLFGDTTRTTGVNVTYIGEENFPEVPTNAFDHFEKWFANVSEAEDNLYVFEGAKFKTGIRRQDIVMYQINVTKG